MKKLSVVAVLAILGAVACTPPPGPAPAVGCYDGAGSDLYYNGPTNVANNAELHNTSDGTCGGNVLSQTVVTAATSAAAEALCVGFGGTLAGSGNPLSEPPLDSPDFSSNHWLCGGVV